MSGAERHPVLLLPGWNGRARHFRRMAAFLQAEGWSENALACLDFRNTWDSNLVHAAEIRAALEELRQRTGAGRVDVVAHSMGGLALRWYLASTTEHAVRRAIFMATPHRGTWLAFLAWGAGAREMRPGSEFLQRLADCRITGGVRVYTIRTRLETHVFPAANACFPGAVADHIIGFPPHKHMPGHTYVCRLVRDCLLEPEADTTGPGARAGAAP